MRKLTILTLIAITTPAIASGTHSVRGYIRKDGTYVAPHVSTNPNSTKLDNWTTKGNVNPITLQPGTVDPYKPTAQNPSGSPSNPPRR